MKPKKRKLSKNQETTDPKHYVCQLKPETMPSVICTREFYICDIPVYNFMKNVLLGAKKM